MTLKLLEVPFELKYTRFNKFENLMEEFLLINPHGKRNESKINSPCNSRW
jgi:glutathione S-transferase